MTGEFAIAVHALVYLNHRNITLSSESLAENVCTNPARVRKVMAKLKKAGILATKEGLEGGYHLLHPAQEISLRQISDALEADFVCAGWKSGNQKMDCLIASGMASVLDDIYGELDEMCKERLDGISVADIEAKIFIQNQI